MCIRDSPSGCALESRDTWTRTVADVRATRWLARTTTVADGGGDRLQRSNGQQDFFHRLERFRGRPVLDEGFAEQLESHLFVVVVVRRSSRRRRLLFDVGRQSAGAGRRQLGGHHAVDVLRALTPVSSKSSPSCVRTQTSPLAGSAAYSPGERVRYFTERVLNRAAASTRVLLE